ncbi:MAG: CRISPR-associated endonuclease Cas2 [Anaerovoracaceae bacterium]
MRTLYIVTYDISNDKRLRAVFRIMSGYGDHMQYSVFRCDLSDKEKIHLVEKLHKILKHDEDQVLFFPLGPAGGEREKNIHAIGRPYVPIERGPVIV